MEKPYKDKEWLFNQYIVENKSSLVIAEEVGVSKRTILLNLKKFDIEKPKKDIFGDRRDFNSASRTKVNVVCNNCGKETTKTLQYINRRNREGRSDFYCSQDCADAKHSEAMKGKFNPNYGGEYYGTRPNEDEWEIVSRKISETMIREGTSKSRRNGRWVGGLQEHDCAVCGTPKEFRPYIHRKIESGERLPCCSSECATIIGRRSQIGRRTSIEIKMAEELANRGVDFNEQYELGPFALDFFLPSHGIVIECDGDYWHRLPEVSKRDKSKNAYINACGYKLFRFWESEINNSVETCVDKVIKYIDDPIPQN